MRRLGIIASVALALAYALPASSADVTVTNPMQADIDAGGYSIRNATNLTANGNIESGGYVVASHVVAYGGVVTVEAPGMPTFDVTGGAVSPVGSVANIGTIYVQDANGATAHLWFKTGQESIAWKRIA